MTQRPLKFRIYHTGRKQWLYDTEHAVSLFGETIMFGELWKMPDGTPLSLEELKDCVAMLFIGPRDKNGTEIYEGDVVEWGIERGEIEMYQGSFGYKHSSKKGKHQCWRSLSSLDVEEDVAVIGNIYENAELLK